MPDLTKFYATNSEKYEKEVKEFIKKKFTEESVSEENQELYLETMGQIGSTHSQIMSTTIMSRNANMSNYMYDNQEMVNFEEPIEDKRASEKNPILRELNEAIVNAPKHLDNIEYGQGLDTAGGMDDFDNFG